MRKVVALIFPLCLIVILSTITTLKVRAATDQPTLSYSRFLEDPFEKYNYANFQKTVADIRAKGHPIPVGHPRVFIHPDNKEALRQKIIGNPTLKQWVQEAVTLAEKNWGVIITDSGAGDANEPDGQPVILANALLFQLGPIPGITLPHTPQEYGQEGVRQLLQLASINNQLYRHNPYLGLPLGYDWLYELMTDTQRRQVAGTLLQFAHLDDSHVQAYNNAHGAELLGPLVVRGDGIDDTQAQQLLDLFYSDLVLGDKSNNVKGVNNSAYHRLAAMSVITPEGPGVEGIHYAQGYSMSAFPAFLAVWYDQTGEDYFSVPYFQNWTKYFTYLLGNEYEFMDKFAVLTNYSWDRGSPFANLMMAMGLARSNPDMASLALYHHLDKGKGILGRSVGLSYRILYLLAGDVSLQPKSPQALGLPTTAHFQGVNHVLGRNSWDGIDSTWASFEGPTFLARDLGPLNDINIWKNGGFILSKHAQWHDYDGGNRSNTLNLYDDAQPGKTFIPVNVMDRAANRAEWSTYLSQLTKNFIGYHPGLRFAQEETGKYLYTMGDGDQTFQEMSTMAGGIGSERLALPGWTRQFLWFRTDDNSKTDHFIVLDRIEKGKDTIQAHIPWHFNLNPQIRNKQTNAGAGDGTQQVQGIWKYQGANRIVATNTVTSALGKAHGRLFLDTLLPHNPTYYRMGGLKECRIDLFGNLLIPCTGSETDTANIANGMWKVEVGDDTTHNQNQTFLHVLQATEAGTETPDTTVLLEGEGLIGAKVAGNVALFNTQEGTIVSGMVNVPAGVSGKYRLFLADLAPATSYTVTFGNTPQTLQSSNTGTLYFNDQTISEGMTISILKAENDNTTPIISNISTSAIGSTTATVSWTTNELTNAVIEYGPDTGYGQVQTTSSFKTNHSFTLSSLKEATLYHYRVRSKDPNGNEAVSADTTFSTTAVEIIDTPPTISITPNQPSYDVRIGEPITFTVTASSKSATSITLEGVNVPAGATFQ